MAVIVNDLSLYVKNRAVLEHITFSAPSGEVTSLVGPNGSGKTLTLKAITALKRPSSGQITIDGHAYSQLSAPHRMIGSLFSPPTFRSSERVDNYLLYISRLMDIELELLYHQASEFELSDVLKRRIEVLSFGEKQRLALACVMSANPNVLILDEPATGLDSDSREILSSAIAKHAAKGKTVITTGHYLSDLDPIVNHFIVLVQGKLFTVFEKYDEINESLCLVRIQKGMADTVFETLETMSLPWFTTDKETIAMSFTAYDQMTSYANLDLGTEIISKTDMDLKHVLELARRSVDS